MKAYAKPGGNLLRPPAHKNPAMNNNVVSFIRNRKRVVVSLSTSSTPKKLNHPVCNFCEIFTSRQSKKPNLLSLSLKRQKISADSNASKGK